MFGQKRTVFNQKLIPLIVETSEAVIDFNIRKWRKVSYIFFFTAINLPKLYLFNCDFVNIAIKIDFTIFRQKWTLRQFISVVLYSFWNFWFGS